MTIIIVKPKEIDEVVVGLERNFCRLQKVPWLILVYEYREHKDTDVRDHLNLTFTVTDVRVIRQYFVIISKSKLQLPYGHVHPIICEFKILHLRFYEPHDKSDDEYQEI
ncbi:hypothetical protein V1477_006743 [Vespula maculifrons]|uniref:Uncharacterized protein n=2 Tax=Vespula TaxID=7451 RepID=A0A834N456_VESVU|nr:hypothetical protein HZH66_008279 [Vespula vulgaris]